LDVAGAWLKEFKRVAMRSDKTDTSFSAVANKLARIVWAVMVRGKVYERSHVPVLAA